MAIFFIHETPKDFKNFSPIAHRTLEYKESITNNGQFIFIDPLIWSHNNIISFHHQDTDTNSIKYRIPPSWNDDKRFEKSITFMK